MNNSGYKSEIKLIRILANLFSFVSALLLVIAGVTWIALEPAVIASRVGSTIDGVNASKLVTVLGVYKAFLDILPVVVGISLYKMRNLKAISFLCIITLIFVPLVDIIIMHFLCGVQIKDLLIQFPYIITLSMSAYLFHLLSKKTQSIDEYKK